MFRTTDVCAAALPSEPQNISTGRTAPRIERTNPGIDIGLTLLPATGRKTHVDCVEQRLELVVELCRERPWCGGAPRYAATLVAHLLRHEPLVSGQRLCRPDA